MRKKIICIILAALLVMSISGTAMADNKKGLDNWSVTFTEAEELKSNFSKTDFSDQVSQLQPGDDITFTIDLDNKNQHTVDWYMSNEVLKSLEEGADAEGGGYSYELTYEGPSISRILYRSKTVGGETDDGEPVGLLSATDALDDFLYLDTLAYGDKGKVTLVVGLDGETQGNAYMKTLADLRMRFAVELDTSSANPTTSAVNNNSTSPRDVVKTGDSNNLLIYFAIMAGSGILFLILAIDSIRRRRKEKKEDAR